MSLLRRNIEARSAVPNYYGNTYASMLNTIYGGSSVSSIAGERVDEVTALGVSTVLACVTLIADTVASMPLIATTKQGDREVRVPLPDFLENPDPENTTRFEFIHSVTYSIALHGEAFILVTRAGGRPIGLLPLHPTQMNVLPSKDFSGRQYLHLGNPVPNDDMCHVRWLTPPQALRGISPLIAQRTMMGLAMAVDRYVAGWYANGGIPNSVLMTERSLTTEAAKNLRESWEASTRKTRRPAILSDGLKWQAINTSAVDMEFNLTYDAIKQSIATIFRIPPHLINVKSAAKDYANVEQSSLNYLIYTVQPYISRLETAISTLIDDPAVNVRFDPSSLLRLDAMTKSRVQLSQIQSGLRSPNELRTFDGLEPYAGGDAFFVALPGAPMGAESSPAVGEDSTVANG